MPKKLSTAAKRERARRAAPDAVRNMDGIKVFFIERTGMDRISLRRSADGPCCDGGEHSRHQAAVAIAEEPSSDESSGDVHPHDDPRWPKVCERCGYEFRDEDRWWLDRDHIYRRHDDPAVEMVLAEAPVGACWNAEWYAEHGDHWVGPDGRSLWVKLPGGHDWGIDSTASNCKQRNIPHKCWVREGRPEDGNLTVLRGSIPGHVGAGSIDTGAWHGYLDHGELVLHRKGKR